MSRNQRPTRCAGCGGRLEEAELRVGGMCVACICASSRSVAKYYHNGRVSRQQRKMDEMEYEDENEY